MEALDNEAQILAKERPKETIEIETEKINTTSYKSKVNPNQEMTFNMTISENAEETCSQQSVELLASFPATATSYVLPISSVNTTKSC